MCTDKLLIWQQNVNKSPTCQHTLLSNSILTKHEINIIVIQEPVMNGFSQSITSKDWILVYPSMHCAHPGKSCTLMLMSTMISTDSWEQLDFPSGDVTAIVIKGEWGKITIFNIYNDGNNNETINLLKLFHRTRPDVTGRLARGQENRRAGRMSALDPQDW